MKTKLTSFSRRSLLGFLAKTPLVAAAWLTARPASATPHTRKILMNDFSIAGFRYYDGMDELPRLSAGTRLDLRPEPSNPHDAFAVEIRHGSAKLGYVPRFCNRHISRMLREAVPLECEVEAVHPQAPPWEAVSVRVWLKVMPADELSGRRVAAAVSV